MVVFFLVQPLLKTQAASQINLFQQSHRANMKQLILLIPIGSVPKLTIKTNIYLPIAAAFWDLSFVFQSDRLYCS